MHKIGEANSKLVSPIFQVSLHLKRAGVWTEVTIMVPFRTSISQLFFFIFIFGYVGSSLLRCGLFLSGGVWASCCGDFSCCGQAVECAYFCSCGTWAQQLWLPGSGAQAQELWHTGLVALQHVGSSWIRDQTCVSFIGRQILYHLSHQGSPEYFK